MQRALLSIVVLAVGCVNARLMFIGLEASSASQLSKQLDNHNIVFVGDSLLRYQYLSLLYIIHYGSFYPAETRPNMMMHVTYNDWIHFYEGTNGVFAPFEHCDCFRKNGSFLVGDIYENRYYYNKERNITVSYIQYFGDNAETHGHWMPSDDEKTNPRRPPDHEPMPFRWQYPTIQETLIKHVAKLRPKPSVLLLNAGHWPNKWGDQSHRDSVMDIAKSLFDRVIWKTTNYRFDGKPAEHLNDQACTYPGVECISLEWTKYLSPKDYTDFVHFQPDIYTDINIQFIHHLLKIEPITFVPMNARFYGQVVSAHGKHFVVDNRGLLRQFEPHVDVSGKPCGSHNVTRTHVHLPMGGLLKHILGEPVQDICTFEG